MTTAKAKAPKPLGPYRTLHRSWIGKVWTGNDDLHYEVWPRPRLGVLELGLHFEADALTNARLLAAFRARQREVRAALGKAPLIEPWDKGWARVYETHPLEEDRPAAERYGLRLAAYVAALEPILRDELPGDVPWRGSL
ncbi:MAG: hypothetical protein AUH85_08580 [Chloroflexi bacterium 13_1_40CM_4_68_4]|nr:MAG: hypothetical protein AUH85_08580 [Chloroflexi bacterium 13_1_40CM_4_68_4]